MKEEEAREIIKRAFPGQTEDQQKAFEAMYHVKDCRICKLLTRAMEEVIQLHVNESKEQGK